ncbi:septum formation family protein [Microbacterium sp. NPDC008134]|jgi:hypothetical protein|uniref:septum formation family protein n=1 Tax=Microbacterium sp. NPDC008134 TaxID=3364183 RepID=UPI0036E32BD8
MNRASRLGIATIAAAAAVALLSGCSVITDLVGGGGSAVRDADSAEITEGGDLSVFTLEIGDCFNDTAGEQVSELPVVPCADPHDNEVYYEHEMPDGEFPGDDAISAAAEENCFAQFEGFVGIAYADSVLEYNYLTPTTGSWEDYGDRLIQCIVYDPSAQVQGTLAGVAR